jgi:hypothetical protein
MDQWFVQNSKWIVTIFLLIFFIFVGIACGIRPRINTATPNNFIASIISGAIKEHSAYKVPGGKPVIIAIFKEVRRRISMVRDGHISHEELEEFNIYLFEGMTAIVPHEWRFVVGVVRVVVSAGVASIDLDYSEDEQQFVDFLALTVDEVILDLD